MNNNDDNCVRLRRTLADIEPVNRDFVANRLCDYNQHQQLLDSYTVSEDGVITLERVGTLQELYNTPDYKIKLETPDPKSVPEGLRKHISKILTKLGGYSPGEKLHLEVRIRPSMGVAADSARKGDGK